MIVVAPEHLTSLRQICIKFRKARVNVLEWRDKGAPIAFDGLKYSAEYNALQNWLVENGDKLKKRK